MFFSIKAKDGRIQKISLGRKKSEKETILEKKCRRELEEYLQGKRKKFSSPINVDGTDFQKKVWKEMMKIPYGETLSYGALAKRIGHQKAYRAVANACGANKIPIIIPCHRVVSNNGLGGYSGGIQIKKKLLQIEKKSV